MVAAPPPKRIFFCRGLKKIVEGLGDHPMGSFKIVIRMAWASHGPGNILDMALANGSGAEIGCKGHALLASDTSLTMRASMIGSRPEVDLGLAHVPRYHLPSEARIPDSLEPLAGEFSPGLHSRTVARTRSGRCYFHREEIERFVRGILLWTPR